MTDIITDERLAEIRAVAQSTFERGRGVMSIGTDETLSLLARLDKAEAGWQDISTAPTNQAIQIHVPGLDYYGNNGVYAGMLVDMGTGPRWMAFAWAMGRDLGPENQPTSWRHLPAPPVGSGGRLADATNKTPHVP